MHKKGVSLFSVETFCLTVLKKFVGEHFSVSENFGLRKTLCIREGGITFPRGTFFHLTVPIKIVGEHICVSEEFWYRKFSRKGEGKLQGFFSKIFFSQDRKSIAREPFCVLEKFGYRKKLCVRERGVPRFSVEKFLSHCIKIILWRTLW